MSLSNFYFRHYALRFQRPQKGFVSYAQSQRILLLFQSDGQGDRPIEQLINLLSQDGKSVEAIGWTDSKTPVTIFIPSYHLLRKADCDLLQRPHPLALDWVKMPFDLLLDLTPTPLLPLQWFALLSKATCKVGTLLPAQSSLDSLYDLLLRLDSPQTATQTANQMLDFLKMIRS